MFYKITLSNSETFGYMESFCLLWNHHVLNEVQFHGVNLRWLMVKIQAKGHVAGNSASIRAWIHKEKRLCHYNYCMLSLWCFCFYFFLLVRVFMLMNYLFIYVQSCSALQCMLLKCTPTVRWLQVICCQHVCIVLWTEIASVWPRVKESLSHSSQFHSLGALSAS